MENNIFKDSLVPSKETSENHSSTTNFKKLLGATSFSNLGDGFYQISIPLLAVQFTQSPALVAGVSIMLSLPWLVFALQAGSIVDRFDRLRVMLIVNGARFVILLSLTYAIGLKFYSLPMLYIAAFLLGIGETIMDTALTSIVPSLVSKYRLNWANARITAAQTITNTFLSPPLAGYLAGIGISFATGASASMYATAGLALISMRGKYSISAQKMPKVDQHWRKHLTEGLRFLWRNHLIRDLTLFTASMNLFWAGWGALFVLYAVKPGPMSLTELEYGILLTAMAIGGLLGSVFSENVQKVFGTRNALVLDFLGTILLVGIPAFTTSVWAVGTAVFLAGFCASVWVVLVASIRQRVTPNALLGRVYSASRFISWGVGPVGAAIAAMVAELWGIQVMFKISGVLSIGLLLFFIKSFTPRSFNFLDEVGEQATTVSYGSIGKGDKTK